MCAHVPQAGRAREGRGGQGQAVPQGEDRCGPDSSRRGDAHRAALSGTVTAFTNKNSNTHRHQSGHGHSALDSEPPLLGTEGHGQQADEVSVQARGATG